MKKLARPKKPLYGRSQGPLATTSSKLLGPIINNTLTWNDDVDSLIKKAAGKIYFLVQLKRACIQPKILSPTTAHVLDLPLTTLVHFSIFSTSVFTVRVRKCSEKSSGVYFS